MNHNPVGWFEIYVQDLDRARQFYETVLGIELTRLDSPTKDIEMLAFPMDMEASGASGALCKMDGFAPNGNGTLIYFSSADCDIEASRVEAAGGKIGKPKSSIGPYGFIALATDTEGNTFGIHSLT
ncbi:Glyoxalase-like domain protein [Novipirellula galeiformis]|uniref:Glyoxalase-like domain protein n=1 Tax=Novipirellula galeiformis TaxID=2528004 RepID=A0A5C6CAM5_9BACT|nr:VOC family protein [Novipirellula galeiformis]TWU20444.1 Glyoxalase-like domain protein [Novipirellula galeiformis]